MNSYNFFTTSTNCKFSHYGPLNIDSNLRPHQMVRHSILHSYSCEGDLFL